MRIVFMGSADMACPCLERVMALKDWIVAGVVTQPDRPRGRSLRVQPCPVRAHVENAGIPVLTPENVNSAESAGAIKDLKPDIIVVVAYGQILKSSILGMPGAGCVNVHASLLPKYRGAAPVEWAIARGEKETGVTTMFMSETMDAGDIIAQASEPISDDDTAGSLRERLAGLGAELLARTLDMVREGTARGTAQAHEDATYAPMLKKGDGRIDWTRPAEEINNRVRGFNPWPVCFFERSSGGRVRVFKTRVEPAPGRDAGRTGKRAGIVLEASGAGPLVGTGDMAVRLLDLQPEGRKAMSGSSFVCGYQVRVGERFA